MVYNACIMKSEAKINLESNLNVESIGKRIARLRKERKYSQAELAKKLGTSQKVISDYELNKLRPHHEVIVKLSLIFGITADELLGLKTIKSAGDTIPSKKILRRMQKIESLTQSQQIFILRAIDSHLKAFEK